MGVILGNELPEQAMEYLRGGHPVVVATLDADGWPETAPFGWVVARDPRTIRLAVNQQVGTYANIRNNGKVRLSIADGAMNISAKGRATVLKGRMESILLPTALVEVHIEEVKDDAVMGRVDGEKIRWERRRQMASDDAVLQELLS
ncbi:MAG: pyridoxamine 5'-phosphate oxidase family protein [Chloroflexi bacterium]|nr:pyridoxamine 5'-phosphate oxidase family protein [Chloroflexota bacterium]